MGQNKSEELQDFRANMGAALSRLEDIFSSKHFILRKPWTRFENSIDFIKCKL